MLYTWFWIGAFEAVTYKPRNLVCVRPGAPWLGQEFGGWIHAGVWCSPHPSSIAFANYSSFQAWSRERRHGEENLPLKRDVLLPQTTQTGLGNPKSGVLGI